MTEKMVNEYIDSMNDDLFDEVTDMLENHTCAEVAKKYDLPIEVVDAMSWYWVED